MTNNDDFDALLNNYVENFINDSPQVLSSQNFTDTEVPDLLKDVKPNPNFLQSISMPSNLSKISTNTTGTDFLEKLLGDTGGNSTGNIDLTNFDKKLSRVANQSNLDSEYTPIKTAQDADQNEKSEKETDSWPKTTTEDDKLTTVSPSPRGYTNDFTEPDQENNEKNSTVKETDLTEDSKDNIINDITALSPVHTSKMDTEKIQSSESSPNITLKEPIPPPRPSKSPRKSVEFNLGTNGETVDEEKPFDLSPIHSSAAADVNLSTTFTRTETGKSKSVEKSADFKKKEIKSSGYGMKSRERSKSPPTRRSKIFTQKLDYSHVKSSGYAKRTSNRPRSKSPSKSIEKVPVLTETNSTLSQTDRELNTLRLELKRMQKQYEKTLKSAESQKEKDLLVLQRENFMLKTKITENESKTKTSDDVVIEKLSSENKRLQKEQAEKEKEISHQTDIMAKENHKLAQKLVLLQEERDQLKQANKFLRSPVGTPKKSNRQVSPEATKRKSPLTIQKSPSKIESLKNQNETLLLPAFLALERQLTSCQKHVENLENEISMKKREIRDLNVEIQKLNFENKSLETRLVSAQDKLSGKISEDTHRTLLTELKNQKNEEINKLQANLVLMKQAQNKLLEQNQFYEENQKIIDKDARTVVRRGNEIVQLKKEVASLHQRLEAALSRKTEKEKKLILCDSVDQNSRAALEQRIKHLEYTLKDKDEFIQKMNRQSQQHHIEQENRERVESLCSSIQLDDSVVKNQNDRILSLQTQLKDVHRQLEECQTEAQTRKHEVGPYKKRCSALEGKLLEESKKVGILNSLLLEAKAKNKNFEAEAGDNETKVEELRKLMVISNIVRKTRGG